MSSPVKDNSKLELVFSELPLRSDCRINLPKVCKLVTSGHLLCDGL